VHDGYHVIMNDFDYYDDEVLPNQVQVVHDHHLVQGTDYVMMILIDDDVCCHEQVNDHHYYIQMRQWEEKVR
jgi:hypothetical protein